MIDPEVHYEVQIRVSASRPWIKDFCTFSRETAFSMLDVLKRQWPEVRILRFTGDLPIVEHIA